MNDAKDDTQLYDAEQLRVFQIIHSSSEFVTSLLEGTNSNNIVVNCIYIHRLADWKTLAVFPDVLNCQRLCDNKMIIELAPFGLTAFVQQVC